MKVGLFFHKKNQFFFSYFLMFIFIFKKDIWKKLARFNHREKYI